VLAATYHILGRPEDAAQALEIYLSEYEGWWSNVSSAMALFFPYQRDHDRARLAEGLHGAGLPADMTEGY